MSVAPRQFDHWLICGIGPVLQGGYPMHIGLHQLHPFERLGEFRQLSSVVELQQVDGAGVCASTMRGRRRQPISATAAATMPREVQWGIAGVVIRRLGWWSEGGSNRETTRSLRSRRDQQHDLTTIQSRDVELMVRVASKKRNWV